ncbi:raffinose/stachyose/melibiose transport system permease protein [Prauserella aidingensis]|uniref:carbohydrate ABC transporter permease n=1 Tax=Prauserella aidingensis TaxID=387890 RepID=UPI0020A3B2E7|nr:carbohydrate ABC transporter permease [Prauserella aidingensis]MCP2253293.1 raffinose/stachyose/melibiose transport system permease protein [Prauserella aidingensis]
MARTTRMRPNVPAGVAGFLWLLVALVPVYYVVITSLRTQEGFFSDNPLVPPSDPSLDSYRLVLESDFLLYLVNSIVVTLGAVLITVSLSLMASYFVVRGTGRLSGMTHKVFLLGLAIPLQATIIPVYYLITEARMYDTLLAIILPSAAFAIPLTVVILSNFLRDVPNELFESMRVDGAGHWRMLVSLVLPLMRPALVTVAVYDGLQVWNGFLFPLILTQSPDQRVLPLALWSFQGQFTVNIPAVLAAVVLSTLPVLALYILGRRHLVSGLTAGFGK